MKRIIDLSINGKLLTDEEIEAYTRMGRRQKIVTDILLVATGLVCGFVLGEWLQ
jgi:hypothetical protein